MTDEVKIVAEKILSWVQILITELHSMKSHMKRTCRTWRLVQIFFTSLWWIETTHINYISRYSYFNISCCNIIFFSRISQLYKCLTLKQLIAAMSVNQHSKWCLSDSLRFEEKRVNSDLDYNKLLLNWMWTCQTTMSVCSSDTYTVSLKVDFKSRSHLELWLVSSQTKF
jgi:hypothetical protein